VLQHAHVPAAQDPSPPFQHHFRVVSQCVSSQADRQERPPRPPSAGHASVTPAGSSLHQDFPHFPLPRESPFPAGWLRRSGGRAARNRAGPAPSGGVNVGERPHVGGQFPCRRMPGPHVMDLVRGAAAAWHRSAVPRGKVASGGAGSRRLFPAARKPASVSGSRGCSSALFPRTRRLLGLPRHTAS
jgi:hypothetical protein